MGRAKKMWMQEAVPPSHKGRLHRALHLKQGVKIPKVKLKKAEHSTNPHLRKMATLAETFRKYHGG